MHPDPIDGRTHLVGLVGWPVEHTLSPAIHNAAFAARGLNWRYLPLPVPPGQVEAAMGGLAALGFRGANVTVPHKRAVLPTLHTVAREAASLGAVNTVVVERSRSGEPSLAGHNTDVAGFTRALRHGGFDPADASVVVAGAGGAARAVIFGLMESGAADIVVLNRSPGRARILVSDLERGAHTRLRAGPLHDEALVECARSADLLVNATPLGMWPSVGSSVWPAKVPLPSQLTVFDLVYNPAETKLLQQARIAGAGTISGLAMLVQQGALGFEMWTGVEAPVDVMRAACEQELKP